MAGQLAHTPDTHCLHDGIALYRRERVVPGLLKPRSLEVRHRGLRMLGEWRGDSDLAATPWRIAAAEWYALEGSRIYIALQMLRGVLIIARREGWRSDPHDLGDVLRKAEYAPREVVYDAQGLGEIFAACERLDRVDEQRASESAVFAGGSFGIRQRAREVIRLLALTGCRLREICNLRYDELGPSCIRLKDSKTGPRTIPLGDRARLVLGRQRGTSGCIFSGRWPGKPISGCTVWAMFTEVRREAGLTEGSPHALRHTAATEMIRRGVPLQVVQQILGHGTASYVTARYVHLASRDTSLGIAVLENAIATAKGGAK